MEGKLVVQLAYGISLCAVFICLYHHLAHFSLSDNLRTSYDTRKLSTKTKSFENFREEILERESFYRPRYRENLTLHGIYDADIDEETVRTRLSLSTEERVLACIDSYKKRYRRDPPVNFDKWVKLALRYHVEVDRLQFYDQIHFDLLPYRRRNNGQGKITTQMSNLMDKNRVQWQIDKIEIENGQIWLNDRPKKTKNKQYFVDKVLDFGLSEGVLPFHHFEMYLVWNDDPHSLPRSPTPLPPAKTTTTTTTTSTASTATTSSSKESDSGSTSQEKVTTNQNTRNNGRNTNANYYANGDNNKNNDDTTTYYSSHDDTFLYSSLPPDSVYTANKQLPGWTHSEEFVNHNLCMQEFYATRTSPSDGFPLSAWHPFFHNEADILNTAPYLLPFFADCKLPCFGDIVIPRAEYREDILHPTNPNQYKNAHLDDFNYDSNTNTNSNSNTNANTADNTATATSSNSNNEDLNSDLSLLPWSQRANTLFFRGTLSWPYSSNHSAYWIIHHLRHTLLRWADDMRAIVKPFFGVDVMLSVNSEYLRFCESLKDTSSNSNAANDRSANSSSTHDDDKNKNNSANSNGTTDTNTNTNTKYNNSIVLSTEDLSFACENLLVDDRTRFSHLHQQHLSSSFVPPLQQYTNRYILTIEGNTWTGRLARDLSSGSTVLYTNVYETWLSTRIQPFVHYIPVPVETTFSALSEIMHFLVKHPKHAQNIAETGQKLAETHLRHSDMLCYTLLAWIEYASLAEYTRW